MVEAQMSLAWVRAGLASGISVLHQAHPVLPLRWFLSVTSCAEPFRAHQFGHCLSTAHWTSARLLQPCASQEEPIGGSSDAETCDVEKAVTASRGADARRVTTGRNRLLTQHADQIICAGAHQGGGGGGSGTG